MLRSIDFLGSQCKLYINSQQKFETLFGGAVTFVLVAVMSILFGLFGRDFYFRINPSCLTEVGNYDDYPIHYVDNSNFTLAFGIEDDSSTIVRDDSIMLVKLSYVSFQYNSNGSIDYSENTVFPNNCQLRHFSNDPDKAERFKDHFCVDFNNTKLGGLWDGSFVYYFYIMVDACQDFTPSGQACSLDKQSILSNYHFMSVYMQSFDVNPTRYDNPFVFGLKNNYFFIDPNIVKNYIYNIVELIVVSDYGWLFQTIKTDTVLSLDSTEIDINSNSNKDPRYVTISFYFGKKYVRYSRTYSKIQSLAANVGGVMKLIFLVGSIIVQKYSLFYLNESLINSVVDANPILNNQVKENNFLRSLCSPIHLNNYVNKPFSSSHQKLSSSTKCQIAAEIEVSLIKDSKITFVGYYFKRFFAVCLKDKHYRHYSKGESIIKKYLDVRMLLLHLMEIEKCPASNEHDKEFNLSKSFK